MAAVTIGSDFGAQENKVCQCFLSGASLIAHLVNHLPAMQETWVQFLRQEDSPGEGNGNPLQYSCLENPLERRT